MSATRRRSIRGRGELSYLVDARAIEELPLNGRNYTDLALLQPSVVAYPHRDGGSVVAHGLGMSVNGQDPRSNVYLLDGTLLNDMTNGPAGSAAGTALGMETVQEFRVETNAYSAEFGRMSGGQINVLTKAGGNSVRGSAYEFHRNDALDAKNYFDVNGKPAFTRNQFGGAFGGPIRRDRVFFFGGYEALQGESRPHDHADRAGRQRAARPAAGSGESGHAPQRRRQSRRRAVSRRVSARQRPRRSATAPRIHTFQFGQTLDQHFAQGRVDYNAGAGNQLFARYTLDDADQFLPTDYPQFPRFFVSRNQFFTSEYRQVLTPSHAGDLSAGLQPHAGRASRSRPTRRRRSSPSCPGARSSATSTSAASIGSGRRARWTCAFCSRCSACRAI